MHQNKLRSWNWRCCHKCLWTQTTSEQLSTISQSPSLSCQEHWSTRIAVHPWEGITHAKRSFVNGHVHTGNKTTLHPKLKAFTSDIKQVWFADYARVMWPFACGPQFLYHPNGSKNPPADEARAWGISKLKPIHSHICPWEVMTCRSNSWLKDFHRGVCLQRGTVLGSGDTLFARGSNHPTACSICCPHICFTLPFAMHLKDHSLRIPLEKDIQQILISAFTGYVVSSELEGEILSVPVRLVGIGLANQARSSSHTFSTLKYCLVAMIATQETDLAVDVREAENKKETRWNCQTLLWQTFSLDTSYTLLQSKVSHHGWLFSF